MPRTRLVGSLGRQNRFSGTVYSAAFHQDLGFSWYPPGDAFRNCFPFEDLVLMAAFLELRRHSSFTEETVTQRQARFEGHLSEVLPTQETAAGDTVVLASDDESPQPRSKLRRRWRLQATTAPVTPPLLEDSPGSSQVRGYPRGSW